MKNDQKVTNRTLGWGERAEDGSELWDDHPLYIGDAVTMKDWAKLLFYPKKCVLYHWVKKAVKEARKQHKYTAPVRILDVGCGTGAAVIDLKKVFGRSVEVVGVDVVEMQVDIARNRLKEYGVWSEIHWYDGEHLPYSEESVDVIYTSDVLGHVEDVSRWLQELYRVLKPEGSVIMFAESKIGKHAFMRKYLMKKGINTDPHAEFHISLHSKKELQTLITTTGFTIKKMMSASWARVFTNPEESYEALVKAQRLPFLRWIMGMMTKLKKKTHPYSTALGELYTLVEMLTLGRFIESQGYVILAKKETVGEMDEEERKKRQYATSFSVDYSPNMRAEE